MSNNDTKYAYAVARIRALENRLLDRSRIEMMLEAKSAQDVLKILSETDYGPAIGEIQDEYEYEEALTTERKNVIDLLKKIAPNPEVIGLLIMKYDFHNMKVLLKAKYLDESADHLLVDAGSVDPEKLKKMVDEGNFRYLPPLMRRAVEKTVEEFQKDEDPQIISFALDKYLYENLSTLATELKADFLVRYFQIQADLINLSAFLRVKSLNKSREFLDSVLLENGKIEKRVFLQLFMEPEPADALIVRLYNTEYAQIVEEGARLWAKNHSTTDFEKLADNYLLRYLKSAKMVVFGAEPLIAYLLAKEIEIKIIRMIMVSKLNGIPVEEIRERLRDVYA
jgi:V/A-type H+/Na+-transporting ATPase subunit C